ncbi:hypothetical protein [Streptomyces sp. G-G2]|uniref:hypothetical protein n=1 Tax=Streptomyces sp. G-G2 TaxID=3046201 RepID=UPI0024B9C686|nr:hypothetical protein [Streptomyces sp. G-G2]MDJ0382675.1 hypothetical protein [Streptomyces sp. G-G2]
MTSLRVDIDQLSRLAQSLDASLVSLREAREALDHVRSDQLGTTDLDTACDDFRTRWAYGAAELAKQVKTVHEGVGRGAADYAELEAAVRDAFRAAGTRD